MTTKQIAEKERRCAKTIQREINYFLNNPPEPKIIPSKKTHFLIDSTYFKRENCFVIYYDYNLKHYQLWRYSDGERENEIEKDLRKLKKAGIDIVSATTDGSLTIKRALKEVYPHCRQQRCLVHIQRFCLSKITQKPKTKAGRDLRSIVNTTNYIKTTNDKRLFLSKLDEWKRVYTNFLKERTYSEDRSHSWYTHRNLRSALFHLENALSDMWHYLENKDIPKDTNGLEGRLTDLKHKFKTHRGLKKTKREQYLSWYLFNKNKER